MLYNRKLNQKHVADMEELELKKTNIVCVAKIDLFLTSTKIQKRNWAFAF